MASGPNAAANGMFKLPVPDGFLICNRCGCLEPFAGMTSECCLKVRGRHCDFSAPKDDELPPPPPPLGAPPIEETKAGSSTDVRESPKGDDELLPPPPPPGAPPVKKTKGGSSADVKESPKDDELPPPPPPHGAPPFKETKAGSSTDAKESPKGNDELPPMKETKESPKDEELWYTFCVAVTVQDRLGIRFRIIDDDWLEVLKVHEDSTVFWWNADARRMGRPEQQVCEGDHFQRKYDKQPDLGTQPTFANGTVVKFMVRRRVDGRHMELWDCPSAAGVP